MQDAFAHCERVVRGADKDRFLATLFAPAARRSALFALYAFNTEVAGIREHVREPLAGELRLQWWRDVLADGREEEAAGHPVARALLEVIARYRLPSQSLNDLIEARAFDLYDDPMPSMAALEGYLVKTSSAIFALAAHILDADGATELGGLVRDAGIAHALAGLLRAFPLHAARRQLYLPLDVLDRHRARPEDVFAGRVTTELRAALAEVRLRARRHLDQCNKQLPLITLQAAPALLPVSLVRPVLDRMERGNYHPFHSADIPQWRRQWILWRAARRIGRPSFRV
jgi:15-cis-phytoene synthase